MDWTLWQDSTYFWDLYPKGHINHDKGFGDSLHNAAMLMSAMYIKKLNGLNGLKEHNFEELERSFARGLKLRFNDQNWHIIRDPRVDTPMSEDQIKELIFPARMLGYPEDILRFWVNQYKEAPDWLRPHHWLHYERQLGHIPPWWKRVLCDTAECIDSIFDWFSDSESSKNNNVHRHEMAKLYGDTFMGKFARWLFQLRIDPWQTVKAYYTVDWLPHQCPIHLAWIGILKVTK